MTEQHTPYVLTSTSDTDNRATDALTLFNEARARSLDMADAIIRTLDVLFAENAAIRAELDELRRTPERQPWKDRREAAAYLGCSMGRIDVLAANGRLPKYILGSSPRYRVEDLDALLTPVAADTDEEAA